MQLDLAQRISAGQAPMGRSAKGLAVAVLALLLCILGLLLALRPGLGRLETAVDRLAFEQSARAIGAEYLASERFDGQRLFCARDLAPSPLCKAVSFERFNALGDHPPLWVLFDGINDALKAPAGAPDMLRAWADLVVALSAYGTLAPLSGKAETGPYHAIDLYTATLAQARICAKLQPDVICAAGLPVPARNALGAAARLLSADRGASTALAASHQRAARMLLESGLL